MGFIGNPNPWAPYDNYKDCSQEICTIYCPQFCYFIFPPPHSNHDLKTHFTPLIIAIIAILSAVFLLLSYYTIATRYCRGRRRRNFNNNTRLGEIEEIARDQWQITSNGLDEAVVKTIVVRIYKKEDGLIEGNECSVCLSEFEENENIRVLPKCSHAFHLPCIDTWLKSHSNCPLCRASAVPLVQTSSSLEMNSCEVRRPHDDLVVVVVDDHECERVIVSMMGEDGSTPKSDIGRNEN
ncbi:hypothetical protein BUALT_Bualt19G0031200 [Buddleja alternifolia]|uniref:RING-type E3 ubiquitin transferase n=1 Tax=Buddleja alternifolia TaxID=168488 RepID=A0AAV6W4Y7_9LAMI|nr:hypothetical protein BUALT_Bualt19G0031200 [Buddleja alternifolia]